MKLRSPKQTMAGRRQRQQGMVGDIQLRVWIPDIFAVVRGVPAGLETECEWIRCVVLCDEDADGDGGKCVVWL